MRFRAGRSGARRPPAVSRLLLRLRRLGPRHDEIEADLSELFQIRAVERGLTHAVWRHWLDVISLWFRRRPSTATSSTTPQPSRPSRGRGGIVPDVIFAIRVFRRQPASFLIAVLGLALAIGFGTAIFSVVNAVMLRGFGIAGPDEVFSVVGETPGGAPWTHPDYLQLQKVTSSISLAATAFYEGSFTGRPSPTETANERNLSYGWLTDVSGTYFPVLGGTAALGRTLNPGDDVPGAERVIVLGHTFWRTRLDADLAILGQTIHVSDIPFTVVGVAASGFTGPTPAGGAPPAGWITLSVKADVVKEQEEARARVTRARVEQLSGQPSLTPAERQRLEDLEFVLGRARPPWNYVRLVGRLAPGVTREQAEADVRARVAALPAAIDRADAARAVSVRLVPVDERRSDRIVGISVTSMMAAVGLVILLASANVANLLLASAVVRRREIGTRLALGASRGRVMRQLLTESLLLGILAGAAGLIVAFWLAPAFAAFTRLPPAIDISPDPTVYAFLVILIGLVGVVSGLAPARYAHRGDLMSVVKSDQLGAPTPLPRSLFRHVLVGAQAAGAMMLLVIAALLGRSLYQAGTVDVGFDPDRFMSVDIGNATNGRAWEAPRRAAFWEAALPRVRQIPGVESASLASIFPLGSTSAHTRLPDGRIVNRQQTSVGFFDTMGVRLLRGRTFTDDDVRTGAPVAVISEMLARQYWGADDPIGSTLQRVWGNEDPPGTRSGIQHKPVGTRVIGVVTEILSELRPARDHMPTIYLPVTFANVPDLIVRASDDPHALVRPIGHALQSVDPDVDEWNVQFARDGLNRQLELFRVLAWLGTIAGGSALALATIGVFGVAAFVTGQRQHEISVRMTLGASPQGIVRLLLRESLTPVAIGLVIGFGAAMMASQVVGHVLFGIGPRDPIAALSAAALLLSAALLAILPPVRRVARVNLAEMLRQA